MRPPSDPIPRDVVAAAAAGDEAALRRVYARLQDYVSFRLLTLAGRAAGLEDLGNDICARAVLNLARYRGSGSFTSWVGKIVVRQFCDWRKLANHRERTKRNVLALGAPPSERPDEVVDRKKLMLAVIDGARRLPPRMLECLVAVNLDGDPPYEAAKAIGGTPRAVANSAYRARVLLRQELEERGLGDATPPRAATPAHAVVGLTPARCVAAAERERGGDDDDR
ncbi:MAG: RNA polymerase sigma factor [Deltaproteobacteria bacterium]|nr:RNA polymerase sigma factor [Deltaproteobacteria bacterium]